MKGVLAIGSLSAGRAFATVAAGAVVYRLAVR
jgi:hypothetical protein